MPTNNIRWYRLRDFTDGVTIAIGKEQRKEAAHDEERLKDAKLSIRSPTVPVEMPPSLSVESENENRRYALVARLMGLDKFPPSQESSAGAEKRVKMQPVGAAEKCDEELKALQRIIEVVKTSISVGLGENYELRGVRANNGQFSGGKSGFHGRGRARLQCQLCGKVGHSVDHCWHRFDQSFSRVLADTSNRDKEGMGAAHVNSLAIDSTCLNCCGSNQADRASLAADNWVVDSGATHHVTLDSSKIVHSSDFTGPSKLIVGNGHRLSITRTEQSQLCASSRNLILKNMFHVPSITKNLVSVSKCARDNGVFFEFHAKNRLVKDEETGAVLLQGKENGGLYQFPVDSSSKMLTSFSTSQPSGHAYAADSSTTKKFPTPLLNSRAHPTVIAASLPVVKGASKACMSKGIRDGVLIQGEVADQIPDTTSQDVLVEGASQAQDEHGLHQALDDSHEAECSLNDS
ncbi:hypothetical protein GQ457_18G015820 [Hibiscus cannabinus]